MRLIDADAIPWTDLNDDPNSKIRVLITFADKVNKMPTIEPERKTGKWIDAVLPNDNGGLPVQVCDQCNTFFPLAYTGGGHRFCPSCGAKMEVEHE